MTYAKVVLIVLQIIGKLLDKWRAQGLINQGYDKAIAEQNALMLRKSQYAKKIMEHTSSLNDAGVDNFLRELEPKS